MSSVKKSFSWLELFLKSVSQIQEVCLKKTGYPICIQYLSKNFQVDRIKVEDLRGTIKHFSWKWASWIERFGG